MSKFEKQAAAILGTTAVLAILAFAFIVRIVTTA